MSIAEAPRLRPAPGALGRRATDVAATAAYIVVGLPLALAELLALVVLALVRPRSARTPAVLERRLANSLLHARIAPLDAERTSLRAVAGLVLLRVPTAAAAASAAVAPLALAVVLVRLGVEGTAGGSDRYLGAWRLGPELGAGLLLAALAGAVLSAGVVDGLRPPLRALARRSLRRATAGTGAVREALAESIGDASLSIVYWLSEREAYVDEYGHPVELPGDDSSRAFTVVEHEGRRVAAIVHDAGLDARPELVRAAAAGSVLALENERLKAALRARVEELRSSRARIVEASLEARQRLERDLHDGAQQQLVSLSLELQMIRSRVGDGEVGERLDQALATLSTALAELRELARGIHPAVLTERGLAAAITVLAERSSLAVDLELDLDERVTPAAEAAAYFVVSEALANVAKYAGAARAVVRLGRDPGAITVVVADDGVGGADASKGSGLRGLADRIAALDGTLTVTSPVGSGTVVSARLPARPLPRAE